MQYSPTFVGFFVCGIVIRLNNNKTGEINETINYHDLSNVIGKLC